MHRTLAACNSQCSGDTMGEVFSIAAMAVTMYMYAHLAIQFWCAILYSDPPRPEPLPLDNEPVDDSDLLMMLLVFEEYRSYDDGKA